MTCLRNVTRTFNATCQLVRENPLEPKAVFLTGKKGSGKTYLLQRLARDLYFENHQRVLVVAPMGGVLLHGVPVIHHAADLLDIADGASFVMEPEDDADASATFAYAFTAGGCWLLVDEVDLYCSPASVDPWLIRAVRYGRHKGLGLITVSQRPANVNRNITAQADALAVFRMTEPRDLDALADRIGPAGAEDVAQLPKFRFHLFT